MIWGLNVDNTDLVSMKINRVDGFYLQIHGICFNARLLLE